MMTRRPKHSERRRHARYSANFHADYWTGDTAEPASGQTRICDISRHGMRLAVSKRVPKGAKIEFTLQVPGDNIPVFGSGVVTWSASGDFGALAGVRFLEMKPLGLARVLDHAYAQWLGA